MFKMSTIGTNTRPQAYRPLINCVINQRLLQALSVVTHAADSVAAHT